MKRIAIRAPFDALILSVKSNLPTRTPVPIDFFIDEVNYDEITSFLSVSKNKKKLLIILWHMLNGSTNAGLYGPEQHDQETRGATAMKFSGVLNSRVYCREFFGDLKNSKKIVLCELLRHKTSEGLSKKIKGRISAICSYEYEFKSA